MIKKSTYLINKLEARIDYLKFIKPKRKYYNFLIDIGRCKRLKPFLLKAISSPIIFLLGMILPFPMFIKIIIMILGASSMYMTVNDSYPKLRGEYEVVKFKREEKEKEEILSLELKINQIKNKPKDQPVIEEQSKKENIKVYSDGEIEDKIVLEILKSMKEHLANPVLTNEERIHYAEEYRELIKGYNNAKINYLNNNYQNNKNARTAAILTLNGEESLKLEAMKKLAELNDKIDGKIKLNENLLSIEEDNTIAFEQVKTYIKR